MIELRSLSCSYSKENILKDIDLFIPSHLTILGANGSGKSTLVRCICSLTEYDGEIVIDEANVKNLSNLDRAKTLSYIPAKLEIYDSFITLYDFILLGRFAYKKTFFEYSKEDKKIADEKIGILGLEHLRDHTLSSLSSGEQQLAMIAAALCQQSKIIIFDEPSANLDPHNSKIIANYIKKLKETHQIILITHDLYLAHYVDSDIAFIKDKKVSLYDNGFFNDEVLKDLYGVEFHSMALKYE
jgi:iron complex transport system ATP-binding protein